MTASQKIGLFTALALVTLIGIFLLPSIPQALSFHQFADTRTLWGVRNFSNVVSNLPFLIVGAGGLSIISRAAIPASIRITYLVLFLGVILTGLGSAYYHWAPDNNTLVWDRIPMTIVFMSFLSAILSELVSRKLGFRLLLPLVAIGVGSVLWWHYTETLGAGDLRLYMWVQYFPMLAVPLLLSLYYKPDILPVVRRLVWIVVWYTIAKVLEQLDYPIYHTLGVSGHALKHLAAMVSTGYFLVLFRLRYAPAVQPATLSSKQ